ncbi:MAG: hypothetical protein K8S22_04185 [Betaproteobacteria bacterium]|nr:hypothetical protein [Betaproteobacteria bacterium]
MVIYMNQYRAANAAPAEWLRNGTDGGEMMHPGRDTAVIPMLREPTLAAPSPELPADPADADLEALLSRMYGLATLI